MLTARANLALGLPKSVGGDILTITDPDAGWPAQGTITAAGINLPLDIFVGPIGLSQRGRDDVERRFQNPGSDKPIKIDPVRLPLLLGVWTEPDGTVFVGMDAVVREGRTTRFSMFVPLHLLRSALTSGWAEHHSATGERLIAFKPPLLPVYVELVKASVDVDQNLIQSIISAAGDEDHDGNAAARGRRSASQLIRDALFSKTVRDSYRGLCAMCGLNYSLIVGAHIYPVAADASRDAIWNGIALCHNHHAAFDSHRIFVDPESRKLKLHEELVRGRTISHACGAFVDMTFEVLQDPTDMKQRPRAAMFARRYEFFSPKYDWAS